MKWKIHCFWHEQRIGSSLYPGECKTNLGLETRFFGSKETGLAHWQVELFWGTKEWYVRHKFDRDQNLSLNCDKQFRTCCMNQREALLCDHFKVYVCRHEAGIYSVCWKSTTTKSFRFDKRQPARNGKQKLSCKRIKRWCQE